MKSAYSIMDIADFLSEMYGAAIKPVPMVEGMESQVYAFVHAHQAFVLRINPEIEGFQKDDHAHRHFASPQIPIPKVVEFGPFMGDHAYCISEKVQGITLQDADEAAVDALLPSITALWRAIGEVDISRTTGYGVFSGKDANAPHSSWRNYLLSALNDEKHTPENVDAALIDAMKAALYKLLPYCPEERRLSHGDFGSNNVLIDANAQKIAAIIDWDNAKYGDPLYDIASAYFWRNWLMCMEKTASYWDEVLSSLPNYRERILCYQLHIGIKEMYESAPDAQTLLWLQSRCARIMAQVDESPAVPQNQGNLQQTACAKDAAV